MQTDTTGSASTGTPATTETVSAERAAVERGDVGAFLDASRARREGKAPATVARPTRDGQQTKPDAGAAGRPAVTGRDGQAAKGPTDADREADERLTKRIAEAVETSTADLRRKNQELEEQLAASRRPVSEPDRTGAARTEPTAASARKALTSADIKKYAAMPGAPKIDDKDAQGNFLYETSGEHAVALADFIQDAKREERASAERQESDGVARLRKEAARVSTFAGRIDAFKKAHPDKLVDDGKGAKTLKLSPEVAGLHGYWKLHEINQERQAKGLQPLPATVDHAIAEEIYDSEYPGELCDHLSAHPEDLATLRAAQSPAQLTRLMGRLEAKIGTAQITTATADTSAGAISDKKDTAADIRRKAEDAVERSVSTVKPLASGTLGRAGAGGESDPEGRAVADGNFAAFQETQRARRLEQLQARR